MRFVAASADAEADAEADADADADADAEAEAASSKSERARESWAGGCPVAYSAPLLPLPLLVSLLLAGNWQALTRVQSTDTWISEKREEIKLALAGQENSG